MARETAKVREVREKLERRLREGYRAGEKFLSAREVADSYGVSYQTAHRLLDALAQEGKLERRAQSGTFVPGGAPDYNGAQLIFSSRAQREGSFGARLLSELTARLKRERVSWRETFVEGENVKLHSTRFAVIWEAPEAVSACVASRHGALILNDRPPPGLGATFLDCVSVDDFSGGASAAQLLASHGSRFCVVCGPETDRRSLSRRDGFLSVASAHVLTAGGWDASDGARVADAALQAGRDGVFCVNDRLAQAMVERCRALGREVPPLVGFDDAPIAHELDLTTIAIPWDAMILNAAQIVRRRVEGEKFAPSQQIFAPRPVVRRLGL